MKIGNGVFFGHYCNFYCPETLLTFIKGSLIFVEQIHSGQRALSV